MSSGRASAASGSVATRARETTRGHGAALEGGGNKVVAVVPLAANGKEQVAGRNGARVDGVAGDASAPALATRPAPRALRPRRWPPLQA